MACPTSLTSYCTDCNRSARLGVSFKSPSTAAKSLGGALSANTDPDPGADTLVGRGVRRRTYGVRPSAVLRRSCVWNARHSSVARAGETICKPRPRATTREPGVLLSFIPDFVNNNSIAQELHTIHSALGSSSSEHSRVSSASSTNAVKLRSFRRVILRLSSFDHIRDRDDLGCTAHKFRRPEAKGIAAGADLFSVRTADDTDSESTPADARAHSD